MQIKICQIYECLYLLCMETYGPPCISDLLSGTFYFSPEFFSVFYTKSAFHSRAEVTKVQTAKHYQCDGKSYRTKFFKEG